ncbi:uncharacterized protein LOC120069877 isoform X3 [Benincasa hispida]|uniref:uncharacterized protein LOC120069877 isoform X3 n=1 Tax=Benincasa hispida TaxID=102211 RepID=UPI0019018BB8|nr:uncharacterized protein LOC120069877 isoform X3 [Benincasa hispida]
MDSDHDPLKTPSLRHKCSACYKQYKKKDHLIEHMRVSYHSVHQPRCGVCLKHFKSFESLREHLKGPLPKSNCSKIFSERGCGLCLRVLDGPGSLSEHQNICCLTAPVHQGNSLLPTDLSDCYGEDRSDRGHGAIAMDCVMAGGGSDGALDICVWICLVDEDEKLIFSTFVQPQIPITNYRDTARYHPLMKTNLVSHSLKYLTRAYLGYDIRQGGHNPYENCVSVMRLYKRMRSLDHRGQVPSIAPHIQYVAPSLDSVSTKDLEKMTPHELYEMSRSNFKCWCLDSRRVMLT